MSAILYGECVGTAGTAAVRISALAGHGCDLEPVTMPCTVDEDVVLWIGAMGPFAARAKRNGGQQFTLCFREPLDRRILDHFTA